MRSGRNRLIRLELLAEFDKQFIVWPLSFHSRFILFLASPFLISLPFEDVVRHR